MPLFKLPRLLGLLICLFAFTGCLSNRGNSKFDHTICESKMTVVLCFDLRNDSAPVTGLLLSLKPNSVPQNHTLLLPFHTEAANIISGRQIFLSWGSYNLFTTVNYFTSQESNGIYVLELSPVFSELSDVTSLEQSLYYSASGLERVLIYKYPDTDVKVQGIISPSIGVFNTTLDAIAVTVPEFAKGVEINNSGQTAIPQHFYEVNSTKFYPAYSVTANQNSGNSSKIDKLEIRYQVPPTKSQEIFFQTLVKFFVAMVVPLIGLFLLKLPGHVDQITRRRNRIVIISLVAIEVIVIVTIIIMGFSRFNNSFLESIGDIFISICAGTLTFYIGWQGKKK